MNRTKAYLLIFDDCLQCPKQHFCHIQDTEADGIPKDCPMEDA